MGLAVANGTLGEAGLFNTGRSTINRGNEVDLVEMAMRGREVGGAPRRVGALRRRRPPLDRAAFFSAYP